jgi:hypothetical protein
LEALFELEGAPEIIQSDNGREFKNKVLHTLCSNWGVKHIFGRARRPQSQGQVERFNQTICRSFAKALHQKPKRWIDIHTKTLLAYNTSYHSAIGKTPFEAFRKRAYKRVLVIEPFIENSSALEETTSVFEAPTLLWCEPATWKAEEIHSLEAPEKALVSDDDAAVKEVDALVSANNSQYNLKMNSYKQVHLRKKKIEAGDFVLVAKDFDNNQQTKRGKFDSFFEPYKFEVLEVLDNRNLTIQNGTDLRTVSKSKVKKVRKNVGIVQ